VASQFNRLSPTAVCFIDGGPHLNVVVETWKIFDQKDRS